MQHILWNQGNFLIHSFILLAVVGLLYKHLGKLIGVKSEDLAQYSGEPRLSTCFFTVPYSDNLPPCLGIEPVRHPIGTARFSKC